LHITKHHDKPDLKTELKIYSPGETLRRLKTFARSFTNDAQAELMVYDNNIITDEFLYSDKMMLRK